MDQDSKYFKSLLIWTLVLFMLASILGIFILFQPHDDRFQYYIRQVDNYIEAKRFTEIPPLLVRATRYADKREQWFSIFKRSYQVCRNLKDYRSFNNLLDISRKFIHGGPEHDALYTASLLWTDQYEKASASLYSISQPGYETLVAESLLSYEVYRNYELGEQHPIEFIKDKISFQEDPDFFHIIGTLSDNETLLYNAVLLYMESGQFDVAEQILGQLSSTRIPPLRMGVVYYDLGQITRALEYYKAQDVVDEIKENQRFSLKQQIGDMQYMLGREGEALKSYEAGLALHRAGSWKLYRNIARLYFEKGYSRKAKIVLEDGLHNFPDQVELLEDYVRFFSRDISMTVKRTLEAYISRFPEDMEAKLLQIRYFPEPMNPTQYQARLWEFFNNSHNNEAVTRFLLWYLSGVEDRKSMKIVLQRYEYEEEKPHWYILYEGILEFLEKDTEKALQKMEEASAIHPSWLYERNKAIFNYSLGHNDIAMIQMGQAVDGLLKEPSLVNANPILSEMYFTMGKLFLEEKDFKSAQEHLENAIACYPENHSARSLLKRIK